jgi:hypothetical protein
VSGLRKTIIPALPAIPGTPGSPGTPGVPAVPGSPGSPGVPAIPAYCLDIPTTVPAFNYVCLLRDPYNGDCLLWQEIPSGTRTILVHTCFPETPAVPPVPAIPPVAGIPGDPPTPGTSGIPARPANFFIGWNAGANSLRDEPIPAGDFQYWFIPSASAVGIVSGVGPAINDGQYLLIPYGFYITNGTFRVIEHGALKTLADDFFDGAGFYITRRGNRIDYYHNSTLVYHSTVPTAGALVADAELYMGDDQIIAAHLDPLDAVHSAESGTCNGTLKHLAGFAADIDGGFVQGELTHLTGAAASADDPITGISGTCTGELHHLVGQSFQANFNFLIGTLKPLVGFGESLDVLHPQYSITFGEIEPLTGFGVSFDQAQNSCQGVLRGLSGFSYDDTVTNPGGFVWPGELTHLTSFSYDGNRGFMLAQYHTPYDVLGVGHWSPAATGMRARMRTPYQVHGTGHNVGAGTLPMLRLSATGTLTNLGTAIGALPMLTFFGSGDQSGMGRMIGKWRSHYAFQGAGHGVADNTLPRPRGFVGSGHFTTLGEASGQLPHGVFSGTGHWDNFGIAEGTLPMLRAVASGLSRNRLPMLTFVGLGHWVVTATYEGYSFTFLQSDSQGPPPLAPTHYTAYPFTHIVRWQGHYYGIGPDGIYLLEGDTFDSAPIVAVVKTMESALGHPTRKRNRALFLTGAVGNDLAFVVTSDEVTTASVSYDTVAVKSGARSHRYKLARGLKGTHLAYQFSNTRGLAFRVTKLAPEIEVLRNTIGG